METFILAVFVLPLTMLLVGFKWRQGESKENSGLVSYRSKRSSKSEASWHFAHQYVSKIWLVLGALMLLFSLYSWFKWGEYIVRSRVMYLQILCLLLPIIPTEIALRKNFDKEGNKI